MVLVVVLVVLWLSVDTRSWVTKKPLMVDDISADAVGSAVVEYNIWVSSHRIGHRSGHFRSGL